jgi:hypothetical protein
MVLRIEAWLGLTCGGEPRPWLAEQTQVGENTDGGIAQYEVEKQPPIKKPADN